MQPELNGPFNVTYLGYLNNTVNYITNKQAYVVLDCHNYGKYRGGKIGTSNTTFASFQSFWQTLAGLYKNNPYVIFNLMNEPNAMVTADVLTAMQAGLNGVRAAGANQLVLVSGNGFSGVHR